MVLKNLANLMKQDYERIAPEDDEEIYAPKPDLRKRVIMWLLSVIILLLIAGFVLHILEMGPYSFVETQFANEHAEENLAFATFLTGTSANISDPDINHDEYFTAARMLGYQILHDPRTRTSRNIPLVVLVTTDVTPSKMERLQRDGFIVQQVEYVTDGADWVKGWLPRWKDVMTKLRIWEIEGYSRVLYIDADMVLTRPLDGVFDEASAHPVHIDSTKPRRADEGPLPDQYLFAAIPEATKKHKYPPKESENDFAHIDYFNSGFMLFRPDRTMFEHHRSLLSLPGRFNASFMDQALLNHAHKRGGTMPWQNLPVTWNIMFPTYEDYMGGVASLHEKWWRPRDKRLEGLFATVKREMEAFYREI
jgi:alpha-N-acetylglucosamine transferase